MYNRANKLKMGYSGALKELGKNLVELGWLLFAAYQWIIVIVTPLALIIGIISLILGKTPTPELDDKQLFSPMGIFLLYLMFLIYIGFAYYYFFKIRKNREPTIQYKFYLILLYLATYYMFSCKIELVEKNYILENIRYSETTVQLYDSHSKKQLDDISCMMSGHIKDTILPLQCGVTSLTDDSTTIKLIDIKPMEIEFSAPGYQPKNVLIGTKEGSQTISVYLEKEKLNDPNLSAVP